MGRSVVDFCGGRYLSLNVLLQHIRWHFSHKSLLFMQYEIIISSTAYILEGLLSFMFHVKFG